MLTGRSTPRAAITSGMGSGGAADAPKMCTLALLAELFTPLKLSAPRSGVALQPPAMAQKRSVSEDDYAAEDEEEDCVIQTLRGAPLSLFREHSSGSGSSSSSSTTFFPPALEKESDADAAGSASTHTAGGLSGRSGKSKSSAVDVSVSSSPSSSRLRLAPVLEVLSMLSLVLQRSPAALGKSGNYVKLLRLLVEHDFAAHAAHDLAELWRRCSAGGSAATAAKTTASTGVSSVAMVDHQCTAMALYCDVLLLYACHCEALRADTSSSSLVNSATGSGKSQGNREGSSPSFPSASPAVLTQLYALNQEMGAALTQAAATAPLRRTVASLTAFLIHHAAQLPSDVVQSALHDLETNGSAARSNMAHMAFVAALPSACKTMSADWQCRALEVMRQATLFDADVQVAYGADGSDRAVEAVVENVALEKFGDALRSFLSIMSEMAWCFCTADALVHLCHAVSLYGQTWATYPASYMGLVNFLHRALQRYRAAHTKEQLGRLEKNGRSGAAVLAYQPGTDASTAGAAPRLFGQPIESLMSSAAGAIVATAEGEAPATGEEETLSMTRVPSFGEDVDVQEEKANGEPMAYVLKCEADTTSPRSFVFYLSLFAYVASALPPVLGSFDELPLFFVLPDDRAAPTATDEAAATVAEAALAQVPVSQPHDDLPLFALCLDMLRANLPIVVDAASLRTQSNPRERQRRLLCEACLSLLTAFLRAFPHSIQRLEQHTGSPHLVQTVSSVVTTIFFGGPCASYQMRCNAYALLYRYASAVDSLGAVLTQLMHPANWTSLSGISGSSSSRNADGQQLMYTQANFHAALQLHAYICTTDEESDRAELGYPLATLAELPAGAFRCAVNGAAVATAALHSVFDLGEVIADENALFATITVPQLPRLFSRLAEALDTLVLAYHSGCWMAGGYSTWQSANLAASLLYKAVLLYRTPALLAAATFPVPSVTPADGATAAHATASFCSCGTFGSEGVGHRTRSLLEVLLLVLCDATLQTIHRGTAELLVAYLQASAGEQESQPPPPQQQQPIVPSMQLLRSTLSHAEADQLRAALLAAQKSSSGGAASNVLRLEVWLAMVRWCPSLFLFLFGPQNNNTEDEDDDEGEEAQSESSKKNGSTQKKKSSDSTNGESASDSEAATAQPENLPFARLLAAAVRSKEASLHEKALALQVLRRTGLTAVVEVKDVAALLIKESGDKKTGQGAGEDRRNAADGTRTSRSKAEAAESKSAAEWEVALLAEASIAYINTVIAAQLIRSKTEGVESSKPNSNTTSSSERPAAFTTSDTRTTPLRRPNLAPLTPPGGPGASPAMAARCKVLSKYADTIDQLLRHAQATLDRCRVAYEAQSSEVRYEDVFEWVRRHNAEASTGGYGDDLSASVMLPHSYGVRGASQNSHRSRRTASLTGLSGSMGSALQRHATPMALTTAASRVEGPQSGGSAALTPLVSLTAGQAASFLPFHRLCPVGPPALRFFRGTGDDTRLNTLATLLEASADLTTVVEQLLWFSGVDTNAAGLFTRRTQALLTSALGAVVACRPHSPLLAPQLARQAQRGLRLAKAATEILESAMGSEAVELEVGPALQQALLQLAGFIRVNRRNAALFADAMPIVTAFPLSSLAEQVAAEALLRDVQAMLHEQLTTSGPPALLREENLYVFDTVIDGCTRYFGRPRTDPTSGGVNASHLSGVACSSSVDPVLLSRLLPTLLQYARVLSLSIHPTQPACAHTRRFASVLECLSCILVFGGPQTAVLGFVCEDTLLGFTRALGQFATSAVFDSATQRHHRLSWHVCWHAVLSLWCVVAALRGPFSAKASGWLPALQAALETTPRFVSAVGLFPRAMTDGSSGATGSGSGGGGCVADRHGLLVWEVEEADVATRLAAALAVQGVPLSALLTSVQAGFLFLQQPRLQQRCVASLPTADVSASEGRRIVAAQAHALRNTLTFLLKQPYYALPRDGATVAAFVFSSELLSAVSTSQKSAAAGAEERGAAGGGGGGGNGGVADMAKSLIFSLDLLRHFTGRELQLLRRLTVSAGAQERSPEVSRTSTGSTASRESSVGRSPSRGPMTDGETVTEADELGTNDGVVDDASDQQAIHLETVQLALNAYALTVDEVITETARAPGGLYTASVMQAIRHTTERLLHTLRSLSREVRDLRRPLLSQIVQAKTAQLQEVLERL